MFGGFFNRMYYGNPNKPDLGYEDLKKRRFKLFFTVLQIRFWKLIQLNLLYSIFWLPTFIWIYVQSVVTAETGEPVTLFFFLILLPCLLFAGLPLQEQLMWSETGQGTSMRGCLATLKMPGR